LKITSKGQVTIPQHVRETLGLLPNTDVEWEIHQGAAVLRKAQGGAGRRGRALIEHMRGRGTVRMSTDEIMALTRDDG
jgi:AbrB family looped-hinge helix DNA binding protein